MKAHAAILRMFSHILPKFPQILPGLSPNQKFWGAVAPPPPTPVVRPKWNKFMYDNTTLHCRWLQL